MAGHTHGSNDPYGNQSCEQEWIPLFVEFIKRTMNDGKEDKDEIVATSPEFKELLKNVKSWNGPLPAHWR